MMEKRRHARALWALGVVLLAGAAGAGEVRTEIPWPGQVGHEGAVAVTWTLPAAPPGRDCASFTWRLTDMHGRRVGGAATPLGANGDAPSAITHRVELPHRGYYELASRLTGAKGEVLGEGRATLGRVAPGQGGPRDPDSPFGVNGFGLAAGRGAVAKAIGIDFVRTDFSWPKGEPRRGQYDLEQWAKRVAEAERHGLMILAIIGYNPAWVTVPAGPRGTDEQAYLEWVRRVVTRYHEQIAWWDLWNEPNLSWPGSPEEFARLARRAAEVIKAIDPDAVVIYPGAAGRDVDTRLKHFTIPSLRGIGGAFPFDVLAVHPYSRPESLEADDFPSNMAYVNRWRRERAGGKPLWISELGWSTATGAGSNTEAEQAAYVTRMFVLGFRVDVAKFVYYSGISGRWPQVQQAQYGLFHSHPTLQPKPAALAYAQVVRRLGEARYARQIAMGFGMQAHLFDAGGDSLAVCWALDRAVSGREARVHADWPDGMTLEHLDGSPARLGEDGGLVAGIQPVYLAVPADRTDRLVAALEKATVKGINPLSIHSFLATDELLLLVRNRTDAPLDVRVGLELPDRWGRPGGERRPVKLLRVDGDGLKKVRLPLRAPQGRTVARLPVVMTLRGETFTEETTVRVEPIYRVAGEAVDGDLSGWRRHAPRELGRDDIFPPDVVRFWDGPADHGAKLWWGWSEKGLYIAADVRDDVHANDKAGRAIREGDSLTFAADPSQWAPARYKDSSRRACIALTGDGPQYVQLDGRAPEDGEVDLAIVRDEQAGRTRYECRITWQGLGWRDEAHGPRKTLNIGAVINEHDGEAPHGFLEMSDGVGAGRRNRPDLMPKGLLLAGGMSARSRRPTAPIGHGWVLNEAFSDEFDGHTLDTKTWRRDPPDWGSWSWEPENAFVMAGKLHLRMRYEKHGRQSGAQRYDTLYYTSGIVRTRKRIRHGYFEARIKAAPRFPGVCPAFWADYAGEKDRRTEIDFVELTMRGGRGPAVTDFNTHVAYHPELPADKAPLREHVQVKLPFDPREDFHVYSCLWTPEKIVWYVDGKMVRRRKNDYWDQPLLMTLSMGLRRPLKGDPPEKYATDKGFPTECEIDYVRVWQRAGAKHREER